MSEKLDVSYSLTEEEKRIFRKFKRSNSAKLTKSEFQTMLRSKLVDGGFGGEYYWFSNGSFDEGVACLSENGLRVKAAMRAEKKLSVRYWITTGVAIAGFLLAVRYFSNSSFLMSCQSFIVLLLFLDKRVQRSVKALFRSLWAAAAI